MNWKVSMTAVLAGAALVMGGCGVDSAATKTETKVEKKAEQKEAKAVTMQEMQQIVTDPNGHKGENIKFYGRVFVEPERDKDGVYLQMYTLNKGSDGNTIVGIKDPNLQIKQDDVVLVEGTVEKAFEGENAMGGKITAPVIKAKTVTKSEYKDAFVPTKKIIDVNQKVAQSGYDITVNKIEIADDETRVYVTVENNSKSEISFYSFNAKITQNGQQFEHESNYDAKYPEVSEDILPGVKSEGILTFKKVADAGALQIVLEGSSDNYDIDLKPFVFAVNY
ncbi:DUF4352 domain-containing protein [Ectobacillus sp. JY-23]|uniref:DUF4352 domain-containing protein n=1 Tax=Ectobacillus sp. JY-23 TaxID=2933872 RepID=UPI001FF2C84D|nr:DUF4352 domain-containing protein [Ectobacillus sp. JY-23]UOY92496.1 DUF4352 domain-containing protein [Ectobacillus sp. JY-23]